MKRGIDTFQTVKTEGSILPADLLRRLVDGDRDIPGLRPEDYHLARSERLNEASTRAWNRLQGAWEGFKDAMDALPESDVGTSLTREKWLLILFQELGYGRLTTRKAYEIEGKIYPVSHEWQNTPIHLVSFRQNLDKRTPGRAGAARVSPHSLVQEFLNRSDDHLWGFVSNGLNLRLLRDNVSLTRQAYVKFDLQAMMDSEAYSDFFLLYLLCHQSRVEVPEGKGPAHCWLEKWYNTAAQQGVRALEQLRDSVQRSIEALGGGFLACPGNTALREKLRSGALSTQDYYRQVLRQVYRLLFLFVAEDRELLSDPNSSPGARKLYLDHYSTQRLRALAGKTRGTRHRDLWRALRLVLEKLHRGCLQLALPALGSYLFSAEATMDLNDQDIANKDLLKAVRALAFTVDRNVLRPVNYRNLGPEELGSVYESLLEMHPTIHIEATNPEDRFRLTVAAGSERKTTGSYYTPTSLVNCLLDSALDPVLDEACKKPDPEKAVLALKVCDPACGSGHFLIAAAHRIAKRLAAIRSREDEPAPEHYQHALRDVIGHCIYGVDINPMSVELCKVSLWMEAMEPGKPLAFLDHRIKCGNSLLGTTPALLKKGIPDNAFKPIAGDDKEFCKDYRKRNKKERRGSRSLFAPDIMPWEQLGDLGPALMEIDAFDDSTLDGLQRKEEAYSQFVRSSGYLFGKFLYDAWCAAFVWEKRYSDKLPYPITQEILDRIRRNPHSCPPWMREEIIRLAREYQFFHWHLEFPDVFKPKAGDEIAEDEVTGWSGGFDCVLGNPPYGASQTRKERLLLNAVYTTVSSTANSAADFLLLSQRLLAVRRRFGLVVPKSLTFSYSWVAVRDHLLPSITHVVDVSEAWDEVLLEQVLVTCSSNPNTGLPKLGRLTAQTPEWTSSRANEAVKRLGIIPTGLMSNDMDILASVLSHSQGLLAQVCRTQRGTGLQRFTNSYGDIPVLAGREITDFKLKTIERFIPRRLLDERPVRLTHPPTAVFQNIIAHITRPQNHIKLIGCVVTEPLACLDTVNLVTPIESGVTPWALVAYLMSDLINWFVHVCIYNSAVRTMHFDGYFLKKIPTPSRKCFGVLDTVGRALSDDPDSKTLWRELNSVVYNAFGVPNELAAVIAASRKPRWPTRIRPHRDAVLEAPEEVPLEEFAAMAYPATETDKAICAAALATVEQSPGLSSIDHLDTLLLATHPDWCKTFLNQVDQTAFSAIVNSASSSLFVAEAQSIKWKECRDYLEQLQAISVRHGDKSQAIGLGAGFASAKSDLPGGVDDVVGYAIKAMKRIAELRKDLSTVPQDQLKIIQVFEEQHRLYQLAA